MKIGNLFYILSAFVFFSAACTTENGNAQNITVNQNSRNAETVQNRQVETTQNSGNSDVKKPAQSEQSVVITPDKVVYNRPKAEMDSKKTFEVTYPKVKAATPDLSKKIEDLLNYEKAFGLNFKEQENNENNSLSSAYYNVNYNKSNILDITLLYDAVTAYPSTFTKNLVIDTKNGVRVKPADIFTNLSELAAKVRKSQLTEIEKAKSDYKKDPENADFNGDDYFKNAKFTEVELNNFSINDEGVTFNYDYEFPHVSLALQPDGKYFYSWAEIKPFIKRDGLLGQFIR